MFLDEPQEDARGPLLRVEVVELGAVAHLMLLGVRIELWVCGPDHQMQQRHPRARQVLYLWVYFVVHCLPQKLDAEVYELVVLSLVEQVEQCGQCDLEEAEEVISLFFGNAELKTGGDGEQDV